MEEDRIKELFSGYKPQLSSDTLFMNRLRSNLHSVELIRRRNAAMKRRYRLAVAVAAVAGFGAGMLFTLVAPQVAEAVGSISMLTVPADLGSLAGWMITGLASVLTALAAYELTLAAHRPQAH